MNTWRLLVGWMLSLSLGLGGPAGASPPPHVGWLPDGPLSSLMLRTIQQMPNGLLWVGTDDGAYRYDGTTLLSINTLRRSGPQLPTVPCNQLLPLPDGQLWLGTEAGLFCFSPTGQLRQLPLPAPLSSSPVVDGLALAPDGRHVWVYQRNAGLRLYSRQGQPLGPFIAYPGASLMWPAPDGSVWLSAPGRCRQLAPSGRVLGEWQAPPHTLVAALYDPQGQPWLLGSNAAYRPGPGGRLREVSRWRSGLPDDWPGLLRTAAGPAVLQRDQVLQLEWTAGPRPQLRQRFALPLPTWPTAGWAGRLCADYTGHWWVFDAGTRGCWHREAAPVFIQPLAGPGGRPYSVRSSVRLPDGRLLVSSYVSGLLTQARDSPLAPLRPWKNAVLPQGNAPVLMGIVPAPVGPEGDWLAAGAFPLLRFDPRTGRLRELVATDQTQPSLGILCLARDPATGRVWAGTRLGLYWYDPAVQTFRPYLAPGAGPQARPLLAGRTIEDLCPDGHDQLWLATPEGVEHLNLNTGARRYYGHAAAAPQRAPLAGARCLYLAPDDRLWVGTRAHGLAVIEPGGRAHAVLSLGQGLPNASVATITPGPAGQLWLGTYQGLVRYQPGSGQLAVYTTAHGLTSDECNARAAYVDPADGSLLIGGVAGLHRIWPDRVPAPRRGRPRLQLTSYSVLSTSAAASRTHYLLGNDPLPALQLAPDAPIVNLSWALVNTFDPSRARYAYRVRGWLADRWLGLGTTPQLRLQGLPPGQYTVEIRAETSQGVAATNVLRLPLRVTAAWWNRPGTWGLAVLGASLAVYWWQRGRLRQLRRENELRTRLAADLHDEVGALLTRVTMQAELLRAAEAGPARRLAALVEDSRAAASTVRDIIWSVDAGANTLLALVDRMRDYLDATTRATGRELLFDSDELPATAPHPLPPTVRQHVYLVFKEAVTNALKYSPAGSPIVINLRLLPRLTLTVENETVPGAPTARAGQGLRSIRHRAGLLRADLHLAPVPGGWQLRLQLPA